MATIGLLDREVYSTVEAARLLGVPASTLRRWLHGHDRAGQHYPPVLRAQLVSGQLVLSPVAESFFQKVEFDPVDSVASRLYPVGRTSPVVIDPRRAWGEPTVSGIRTDNLYELWLAGDDPGRIADAFDLSSDQVQAALRFESDPDRGHRSVA